MTLLEALGSANKLRDFVANRYDARITRKAALAVCKMKSLRWIRGWNASEGSKQSRFKFIILPHLTQIAPCDRPTAKTQVHYAFDDYNRVIYRVGPTGCEAGGWDASPWQENAIRELEEARANSP